MSYLTVKYSPDEAVVSDNQAGVQNIHEMPLILLGFDLQQSNVLLPKIGEGSTDGILQGGDVTTTIRAVGEVDRTTEHSTLDKHGYITRASRKIYSNK